MGVTREAELPAMEVMTPEALFHTLVIETGYAVVRRALRVRGGVGVMRLRIEETPMLWTGESCEAQDAVAAGVAAPQCVRASLRDALQAAARRKRRRDRSTECGHRGKV